MIQFATYLKFGVFSSCDTPLYIGGGNALLNNSLPSGREFLYVSYMSLFSIVKILNLHKNFIVFFHLIAALLALITIYKITLKFSDDRTAFISGLLYLIWFKFHQWNFILYTDSLFTSLSIVCFYLLIIAKSYRMIILTFLIFSFTILIRPTGVGLLIAGLIYVLSFLNKKTYLTQVSIALVLGWFILNYFLTDFSQLIIKSYTMAEIIYPKIPMYIEPPVNLELPNQGPYPVINLLSFVVLNPIYSLKLFIMKASLFLFHAKPYYSLPHNIFVLFFLIINYVFFVIGFQKVKEYRLKLFVFIFIAIQILTVGLTSENWDGRFLFPILPFVIVFSAIGMNRYLKKFFKC